MLIAGEALACCVEHDLGEVKADARRSRDDRAWSNGEQAAVARPEVEYATNVLRVRVRAGRSLPLRGAGTRLPGPDSERHGRGWSTPGRHAVSMQRPVRVRPVAGVPSAPTAARPWPWVSARAQVNACWFRGDRDLLTGRGVAPVTRLRGGLHAHRQRTSPPILTFSALAISSSTHVLEGIEHALGLGPGDLGAIGDSTGELRLSQRHGNLLLVGSRAAESSQSTRRDPVVPGRGRFFPHNARSFAAGVLRYDGPARMFT